MIQSFGTKIFYEVIDWHTALIQVNPGTFDLTPLSS